MDKGDWMISNLTPVFKKFLLMEDTDPLFGGFNNGYSYEYDNFYRE